MKWMLLAWPGPIQNIFCVLINLSGKANGQAYVAIDASQAPKAFAELNNKFMGKRYVE
jgi:hypothetical protein